MYDWGIYSVIARKIFCPLIYRLYKKLSYCAPKHTKQDFERTNNEPYKEPEHNPNREENRKTNIFDELDNLEKQIMENNWGGIYKFHQTLRPLIDKFYKKLNYCTPKRTKQDFEQTYDEPYKVPEHNPYRDDLSQCEAEVYTKIENMSGLYNSYFRNLQDINNNIDNLQNKKPSEKEYEKRRQNIINELD